MPHVKKRVKTRERQDGTTVSTTVYQAVWREHPNGADRTKEFRRKVTPNGSSSTCSTA